MKAVIYSFTRNGAQLSIRLQSFLLGCGFVTDICTIEKFASESPQLSPIKPSLTEAVARAFSTARLLVFIGATGIAIRSVAPYIKSKDQDPAVISIDEQGRFVIPLLSGHIGGANALAERLASFLKAVPVITTATDVNQLFSIDEWATRHNMAISSLKNAKTFAAYLVDGKTVGVRSDFPITGKLPTGMFLSKGGPVGVAVSLYKTIQPFVETVVLRPRILHLGIGCRRDTPFEAIEALVIQELTRLRLTLSLVTGVASIDVKKDEQGLLHFAKEYALPIKFYSAEELMAVPGEFTPSKFVQSTVGVDNVCERAAVLNSGNGVLLLKKTSKNGVTLAIAMENFTVDFND